MDDRNVLKLVRKARIEPSDSCSIVLFAVLHVATLNADPPVCR